MALTFGTLSGSYLWPVEIPIAIDGGEFDTLSFKARYRRFSQKETEAILRQSTEGARSVMTGEVPKDDDSDVGIARRIMIEWQDMPGDSGTVPFSIEAFEQLLSIQGAARAINLAWIDSINGKKAKN
jgi:hypothetical protein